MAAALISVPSLSGRLATIDTGTASSFCSSCVVILNSSNRKSSSTSPASFFKIHINARMSLVSATTISCCRSSSNNRMPTPPQHPSTANSLSPSPLRPAEEDHLALHLAVAALERLFSSPSHSALAPALPSPGAAGVVPPASPYLSDVPRRPLRVAYQGSRGSYCQEAAAAAFSALPASRLAAFPCSHMEDAFAALEDGAADRAVVPAENSLDGPIHRNLDLLLRHPRVQLSGELVLPVNHCLLALPGTDRAALARVASHPQALAHCRARLAALGLQAQEVPNAADAARALADGCLHAGTAVVGSRVAAREFGLAVLQENLQDPAARGNYTRFLQLTLRPPDEEDGPHSRHRPVAAGRRKATVAFALERGPSELFRALLAFQSRGIAVTRVDHRPNRSNPVRIADRAGSPAAYFDYVFIMEVEEPAGCDSAFDSAVDGLRRVCGFVRVLGQYACERSCC